MKKQPIIISSDLARKQFEENLAKLQDYESQFSDEKSNEKSSELKNETNNNTT